jgi:integrase
VSGIVRGRVTKLAVERLLPGQILRDIEFRGFGARRQKDRTSYFLQKKVEGRVRFFTIGPHGQPWTADSARKAAHRILNGLADGVDPTVERRRLRDKPSLRTVTETFFEEHGPKLKQRTRAEYQRLADRHILPELGSRRIDDIARSDVSKLHAGHKATPRQANHILAVLSKIMSWSEDQGWREEDTNPCRRIAKYRENRRERFLTIEEIARLGKVLRTAEDNLTQNIYAIAAIRLLLLTGMRLSEVLTLKWEYIDAGRRLILLPDSKTGFKPVPLNPPAIEVLKRLPRVKDNPYVIVGHKKGDHLKDLQAPWRALRADAKLGNCRIHDLRHSYASFAAASGASLPMIGALLVHKHVATTARYTHLANDPVQQLNDEIGAMIGKHLRSRRRSHRPRLPPVQDLHGP